MALSRLGDYITVIDIRNSDQKIKTVFGLNNKKEFMPTVATIDENSDLSKYKLVEKGMFVFSGMQTGRDQNIRIGYSDYDFTFVISPAYTTFKVTNIIPTYFFMIFKSTEMDRYGAFLSDSSVRSNLDWDVFCNIELDIPPIEVQQKVVAVYLAMVANQKAYEKGLEDLKITCEAYIVEIRKKHSIRKIDEYIEKVKSINSNKSITDIKGVSAENGFIETKANMIDVDISKYQIVQNGDFAFTPTRINIGSIALMRGKQCVVSPFYEVFRIIKNELLPEYLLLWLKRKEFYRWTLFKSDNNVRQTFSFNELLEVEIPIPNLKIQKSIIEVFDVYEKRKKINEELKTRINEICPILIKGSIT